ncbi:MAG: lasso peptide biosynthesis B2 protein [Cyanobacteria bacterium P01_G01_bin.54]
MNNPGTVTRKICTAWRLSPLARSQFFVAYLLLLTITLALKLRGFRWTKRQLNRWTRHHVVGALSPQRRSTTLAMVRLAVRYSRPWANCLRQSLTLWTMLRWQGVETVLRIGMRRVGGKLESHAWLEDQGCVIGDRTEVQQAYQAFGQAIE